MEQLSPHHVPVYSSERRRQALWRDCAERSQPVVAVRDAERGFIVRYDLQHLDRELAPEAVRRVREHARSVRSYPTGTDPISESEGVGGEAGPVSGDLHAPSEDAARSLASQLSAVVFDAGSRVAQK